MILGLHSGNKEIFSLNQNQTFSTENVTSADNQQERLEKQIYTHVESELGGYITGFVDGEGSFNISLRKKSDYSTRWQPVLSFNVSQRDITMLNLLQRIFQCGIIKRRKDGLHSYDVTNPEALQQRIIPFFQTFKFKSINKSKNFAIFVQAVELMLRKEHLQPNGLRKLLLLRENINMGKGRTRKYSFSDVFQESSETTRRAPPVVGKI